MSVNPVEVLEQLNAAAVALDKASNRLVEITREFEGHTAEMVNPETGEALAVYQPGPQLLWLEAVGDALDELAQEYEDAEKRPPAVAVLERRAVKRAKGRHPDLYSDFHRLESEAKSLQKWISAKKETISARQSVLKAEGILSGQPPQWTPRAA